MKESNELKCNVKGKGYVWIYVCGRIEIFGNRCMGEKSVTRSLLLP